MSMVATIWNRDPFEETFSFKLLAGPSLKLSFDRPMPLPVPTNRPCKRRRALSDVDGDGNEGRKKRRLRLHLITSRLSRPFSQPASNIVNRGIAKIPIWGAKNKALSKGFLRKAAIMNRVRMRMDAAKDFIRMQQEKHREKLSLRDIVIQKPRCHEIRLPPSPLGLSNYDALDLEDEILDEFEDEGMDGISAIYSDFSIMRPDTEGELDDEYGPYAYLDTLDGLSQEDLHDTPPSPPPEESIVEMLKEKGRQGESRFVQVRE